MIPNRDIAVVGRFHRGVVRAYLDVQVPDAVDADTLAAELARIAAGFRAQHAAAVVGEPEIVGVMVAGPGGWQYIRVELRIWPGQQALVETIFRQRILAYMRTLDDRYADWMAHMSYRVA